MNTAIPAGETIAQSRIDEEDIRLTTGFADIFTAILLVVGGTILAGLTEVLGGLVIAGAAFALARPLVHTRRFAACGNVLAVGAALGTGLSVTEIAGSLGLLAAAGVSAWFWKVHRVPMALALVWITAVGFCFTLGNGIGSLFSHGETGLTLLAGSALFAAAMWYDTRDRLRQTRLTDVAFWLHLASAPVFVHGLFAALGTDPFASGGVNPPVVLVAFFVLTLISLAIDRRPLLASAFIYLVAATASLIREASQTTQIGERELNAAMAPAVIGVLLLALAAGWTPLRRAVLALLPGALTQHLAPASLWARAGPDQTSDLPEAEKEPVRLVLGFNDFFVALGALALFVGSIFVGAQLAILTLGDLVPWSGVDMRLSREQQQLRLEQVLTSPLLWLPIALPALAMWLVAEYFVRIRRMAWPAIVAALAFSLAMCAGGVMAGFRYALAQRPDFFYRAGFFGRQEALSADLAWQCAAIACGFLLVANLLFWWRHRVPISFALAVASLVPLAVIDLIVQALTGGEATGPVHWQARLLAAGLAVFALAMLWDRADSARQTQRADTAFWLHLLAAALAIPALYWLAIETDFGAGLVLVGFLGVTGLALAIDRRAPLVVALPFALSAIATAFGDSGVAISLVLVVALLAVVLRWEQARGVLARYGSRT